MALGVIFNSLGRFDEAAAQLEQALAINPRLVNAYRALVDARRITEADQPLIGQILSLLEQPNVTDSDRIVLHFVLGRAFNDLADYGQAMRHFDAAHRLLHRHHRLDHGKHEKRVDGLIARFTPEFFARHAHLRVNDDRPLLILGMPRSGTTLVEQIIASHPAVAAGGELRFWGDQEPSWEAASADGLTPSFTRRLAEDYRAILQQISPAAARVTDKNPFNFMWVGLIHLIFPQARIIHCRRSPIDTCLSIYTTFFSERLVFTNDRNDLVFYYRQYERLMAHWRSLLPADRFLEVSYEELITDRERTTRELVAFCGLAWDDACLHPEDNLRTVVTASQRQVRQPVYRYFYRTLAPLRTLARRVAGASAG